MPAGGHGASLTKFLPKTYSPSGVAEDLYPLFSRSEGASGLKISASCLKKILIALASLKRGYFFKGYKPFYYKIFIRVALKKYLALHERLSRAESLWHGGLSIFLER
jgi:hypothetical protein